jgi:hypothetical protein
MRLSYIVTASNYQAALEMVRFASANTPLPAEQWEAWVVESAFNDQPAAALPADLPNVRGPVAANRALAVCNGQYVLDVHSDIEPADGSTITSLLTHLDSDAQIGAVTGRLSGERGGIGACWLPTLQARGAACFRKSVLDRVGGFSTLSGRAGEYDLTFRIVDAGFRVDHRDEIVFQARPATTPGEPGPVEIRDQIRDMLTVAARLLPGRLSEIYWHDWKMRYTALAVHAGQSRPAAAGTWTARLRRLMQIMTAPDAVGRQAIEAVFEYRRHSDMVGDWARRNSVWRVVLADFSDNIWATYNACRSNGLQLRCISDENPAFHKLVYRDLPIVPAKAAFEGGGIDGVIVTNSDPARIEPQVEAVRRYFHGPILRLAQSTELVATAHAA